MSTRTLFWSKKPRRVTDGTSFVPEVTLTPVAWLNASETVLLFVALMSSAVMTVVTVVSFTTVGFAPLT